MADSDQAAPAASISPDPRRWHTLALLGIAQLMLIVDVTVVAVALPDMGADLGLDRAGLTWVVSIYALVFGGLMLLGGKAADVFGPRRVVLAGLALFTVASLLAGVAGAIELLLLARALQGVGAAMMSPAALSVIVRTFAGAELTRALGVWSGLGGAGAAVGVLLGGVLTAGPGWEWVFFINVPMGIVLLLALRGSVRPMSGSAGRLDMVGAAIATAATAAVIYGLVSAGDYGWLSAHTLIAAAAGLGGYALFGWWINTASAPLVDPRMLRRRPVLRGMALVFVATALMIAVFFLGSFVLQGLHGLTALQTGLSFLPVAVGTLLGSTLAGRLLPRWGVRVVSAAGLLIAAAGLAAAAAIASVPVLIVATGIAGFGIGAGFVAAAGSLFSAVRPQEAGVASGALSTFHEFGAATGVSAVSSVVAAALLAPTADAFAAGYWFAAAAAAVVGLLSLARPKRSPMRDSSSKIAARARIDERHRIATEMHDLIGHSLTVALLHLGSARLALDEDIDAARTAIAEAENAARNSLDDVRTALGLMRRPEPAPGSPESGITGIPDLVDSYRNAGADIALDVQGTLSGVVASRSLAAYRIVQESLTNAVRHGDGGPISVQINVIDARTRITVRNGGASRARYGSGTGIAAMNERLAALGGTLAVGPAAGGWLVEAVLPG